MADVVRVAVGVLEDQSGRILLQRRDAAAHQGGLWEFPGGKIQPEEAVAAALRRELREELGIEVGRFRPLISIRHDYGDRVVILETYRVLDWNGEPAPLEGQPLSWVDPSAMARYPMPAADRPIVNAIRLPAFYNITPAARTLAEAESMLAAGPVAPGLVQIRQKTWSDTQLRPLATAAISRFGASQVVLNAAIDLARELGCGVHLTSSQLSGLDERPLAQEYWVGASCHDATELARAAALGLDFAVLSPVAPTGSHPGAPGLGWDTFANWVRPCVVPVYALGGMAIADVDRARAAGAQGVAGISAFWASAPRPG